ncbi:molybdopterin molybdotransferase MoeA [Streptomyces variegatus]|uniref:molybdopterin molybdotransferase MoeA n=1 Tax=Streptomyces variegatus TaxID=284040 RepID=UPI003C2AEA38
MAGEISPVRADHSPDSTEDGPEAVGALLHGDPPGQSREHHHHGTGTAWDRARERAHSAATQCPPVRLPLAEALGECLVRPLTALSAMPAFDTAAMDGFAVCGLEADHWTVVGRVLAGATDQVTALEPGQAVEIATGAPVPPGTSAVLPYERVWWMETDRVSVAGGARHALAPGQHIRRTGEECEPGDLLLPAQAELTAVALGLAAAAGHDDVEVAGRPSVRALVTGDELITSGLPGRGRIRDATGPQLPGLVAWAGGRLTALRYVPDDLDGLVGEFDRASEELLIVCGSSSVGPVDHLQTALRRLGAEPLVTSVNCRPGHPQSLHRLPDGRLIAGLPGNPLATLVGFLTLVVPAIGGSRGLPLPPLGRARNDGIASHPRMTRLVPVSILDGRAVPLQHGGSAMLRSAAQADAFAVLPPGPQPPADVSLLALPAANSPGPW